MKSSTKFDSSEKCGECFWEVQTHMINDANRTAQQRSSGALQKDRRGRHGEGNVFSPVPEILEKIKTQKCALPCRFAGFVGSLLWSRRSSKLNFSVNNMLNDFLYFFFP